MIHIVDAGFGATVQDLGRYAHIRSGVPVSGAADPFAFRAAQALVGNAPTDAALEVPGLPFSFRCDTSRVIAVTGRDITVTVRDRIAPWTAMFVRGGDLVRVTGTDRSRYTYIGVTGGITSELVLGSRAAYPRIGIGRTLRAGESLAIGAPRRAAEDAGATLAFAYDEAVAAIAGPHTDRFAATATATFFSAPFRMSAQSDRQGAVLDGPAIASTGGELVSCGIVTGAVQVTRGGQPIVALADHGTTGGYAVIATVAAADIGRVAQRAPGESLRFYRVDSDDARSRWRDLERSLASA